MKTAILSDDRIYRYMLWRQWAALERAPYEIPFVVFIGLNPSTADERLDDPTIRRCIGFATEWGFGALCMTNLFAFRATQPADMKRAVNPTGLHNQHHLLKWGSRAALVVAAWGVNGTFANQDLNVRQWLSNAGITLHHLGLSKHGHPKHPLYLKADTKPQLFR